MWFTCECNGAVGVDPSLNGHTSIYLFTDDPNYVNQDLQCRVNGGQSAFIGVYVMNGGGFRSTHNSIGNNNYEFLLPSVCKTVFVVFTAVQLYYALCLILT